MYDERLYYDPMSDGMLAVRFYMDFSYKYFNLPDRVLGEVIKLDGSQGFEEWLDLMGFIYVGSVEVWKP